jgi:hypothetical protein
MPWSCTNWKYWNGFSELGVNDKSHNWFQKMKLYFLCRIGLDLVAR